MACGSAARAGVLTATPAIPEHRRSPAGSLSMTLNVTPKQMAEIIANAVRSTLTMNPTPDMLEHAVRAAANNAAQALCNLAAENDE